MGMNGTLLFVLLTKRGTPQTGARANTKKNNNQEKSIFAAGFHGRFRGRQGALQTAVKQAHAVRERRLRPEPSSLTSTPACATNPHAPQMNECRRAEGEQGR
jgi:hypothetical protein